MMSVRSNTSCSRTSSRTSLGTTSTQKRKNRSQFALYYSELCQLKNIRPLAFIKQHLEANILDFTCDRVKYEEWWSIINAISTDRTLHFIGIRSRHPTKVALETADTELKAKAVAKQAIIKTRFILMWLAESLKIVSSQSQALNVLELEGLPLAGDYLEVLCQGLKQTTSIQHLSFHKSYIQDEGVNTICSTIKNLPSIVSIDLSSCGITEVGAGVLASLIKYQKISRYSETWKQTLRNMDSDVEAMPGLRRITLNNNEIGDTGAISFIEEVKDDLWIRALDLQDCSMTNDSVPALIDLVETNLHLVIVDVRDNPFINEEYLTEIMNRLAHNNVNKLQSTYKWISKSTGKKSFMCKERPGGSTNRTTKTDTTLGGFVRSHSTLGQSEFSTRVGTELFINKRDLRMEQTLLELETLKSDFRELTDIMNQEIKQRRQIVEENLELKKKLEKLQQENKQLKELRLNTISEENKELVENIITRFGSFVTNDESGYSIEHYEDPEITGEVTSLHHLLNNFAGSESGGGDGREIRSLPGKLSNDVIWEEDENPESLGKVSVQNKQTRAHALFSSILQRSGDRRPGPIDDSDSESSGDTSDGETINF